AHCPNPGQQSEDKLRSRGRGAKLSRNSIARPGQTQVGIVDDLGPSLQPLIALLDSAQGSPGTVHLTCLPNTHGRCWAVDLKQNSEMYAADFGGIVIDQTDHL